MPPNPFHLIADKADYVEFLNALANTPEQLLEAQEVDFRNGELSPAEAAEFIVSVCSRKMAEGILVVGAYLYVGSRMVEPDQQAEQLKLLCDAIPIRLKKAYDCINIWKAFGKTMLSELELMKYFPTESLRILSQKQTRSEAREAARAMARRGERVTIREAKRLAKEYAAPGSQQAVRSPSKPSRCLYTGQVVRIYLGPDLNRDQADWQIVIEELRQAIEALSHQGQDAAMAVA